jgi:hypothetical protein
MGQHRLMSVDRCVDYRQPAVRKMNLFVLPAAGVVRPAALQALQRRRKLVWFDR